MHYRVGRSKLVILLFAAIAIPAVSARPDPASASSDPLRRDFAHPPAEARPRAWWHWRNGNISELGIRLDLDWMARIGLGGVTNFDAALDTPRIVPKRIEYLTPEWRDAFRLAVSTAAARNLEYGIAASPGWSETGGPWVPPADGMKKLTWSETVVEGGGPLDLVLEAPPKTSGPFGDASLVHYVSSTETGRSVPALYVDAKVLAYRLPPLGDPGQAGQADYRLNGRSRLDPRPLTDNSYQTGIDIPREADGDPPFIDITYPERRVIRSFTVGLGVFGRVFNITNVKPRLEASEDGTTWRTVAELPIYNGVPSTAGFAPVAAARFRVRLLPYPYIDPRAARGHSPGADVPEPPKPGNIEIRELRLSSEPRIDAYEVKAGFAVARDYYGLPSGVDTSAAVPPADVIDITGAMGRDGRLRWTPPPGRWKILRLGYSLTGTMNHPANREATGLEVDKLDRAAVARYFDRYLDIYTETLGPGRIGPGGLNAMVTDSIETGPANWTPKMIAQFRRLRGYDPTPWLPALTGAIIGSRRESDAFLYDYRRTIADLITSEHYCEVARLAHQHRITLYGEALESDRPVLGDDLAMRHCADIPMAAMWMYQPQLGPRQTLLADMKGAASVGHLYGRKLIAAESLTSINAPWAFSPAQLRSTLDLEFAYGINRPVLHSSVHQPTDETMPGLSLFIFGQYFNRHETWAEMAKPWVDYIARTSFLLQQGRYVADVAYFYGEEAPLTALYFDAQAKDAPVRYGYDFVNADALLNLFSVRDRYLVTASGMRYRLLYLGGTSERMTLPVLHRIAALARQGATIVGRKPRETPSLADDLAEFRQLADSLWSAAVTRVGAGRVIDSGDVEAVLASGGAAPDFSYSKPSADTLLLFVHRALLLGDAYFISNRRARRETVQASFRVAGRVPELWHADTGAIEPVSYRVVGGRTSVALSFAPEESLFVLFRKPTRANSATIPARALEPVATVSGPWQVAFEPGRGAPPSTRLIRLGSLSESEVPGIRYFSGVASYTTDLDLTRKQAAGPLVLDLGSVGDVAEVTLNGRKLGTVWKWPFQLNLDGVARPGRNELVVRVANRWVNRLVGDAQPGATKVTYTTLPTYRADAPLLPSGLLGPVTLSRRVPARGQLGR